MRIFQESTNTSEHLMLALATTFGLHQNKHSLDLIEKTITLDDLFIREQVNILDRGIFRHVGFVVFCFRGDLGCLSISTFATAYRHSRLSRETILMFAELVQEGITAIEDLE